MTYAEKAVEVAKETGVDALKMVDNGCPDFYFNGAYPHFNCHMNDYCAKCWDREYKNEEVLWQNLNHKLS